MFDCTDQRFAKARKLRGTCVEDAISVLCDENADHKSKTYANRYLDLAAREAILLARRIVVAAEAGSPIVKPSIRFPISAAGEGETTIKLADALSELQYPVVTTKNRHGRHMGTKLQRLSFRFQKLEPLRAFADWYNGDARTYSDEEHRLARRVARCREERRALHIHLSKYIDTVRETRRFLVKLWSKHLLAALGDKPRTIIAARTNPPAVVVNGKGVRAIAFNGDGLSAVSTAKLRKIATSSRYMTIDVHMDFYTLWWDDSGPLLVRYGKRGSHEKHGE